MTVPKETTVAFGGSRRSVAECRRQGAEAAADGPIRLAVLNSHPIQYFAPLYAYLNSKPEFEVTALYMSDTSLRGDRDPGFGQNVAWDIDLLSGYRSVFLGKRARRRTPAGFFSLMAPEVWSEIRSRRYDALMVHGHHYAGNLIAIAAAKSVGIPILVRGETHLGLLRASAKRWLRKPIMNLFYRFIDRAMAIGSANAAFYRAMGVPSEKIFLAPYTVDNTRFTSESRLSAEERTKWREHLGIPLGSVAVLYSAKFTRRKHPEDLLAAARVLNGDECKPYTLVMCGSGELEQELRDYCDRHRIHNVVFTGFVNQANMPKLYGACDIFVLPSENEPWALAVNEAMCAGLPVVLSREIGCVADLVRDGVNGFTFEAGDVQGLASSLRQLIQDDELRIRQSGESLRVISRWGYAECAEGLHRALGGGTLTGAGGRPRRRGLSSHTAASTTMRSGKWSS